MFTYIYKPFLVENTGQLVTCHRIVRLEIVTSQNIIMATVASYASPEATAHSWMQEVIWPIEPLEGNPVTAVCEKLIGPNEVFEGGSLMLDTMTPLDRAKEIKRSRINASRDYVMYGGCQTFMGRVDTTLASLVKLQGLVTMADIAEREGNTEWSDEWTMYDDTDVPVNAAQAKMLGFTVGKFVSACQANKRVLRTLLDHPDTDTVEKVEAINEGVGWPDPEVDIMNPPSGPEGEPEPEPEPEEE